MPFTGAPKSVLRLGQETFQDGSSWFSIFFYFIFSWGASSRAITLAGSLTWNKHSLTWVWNKEGKYPKTWPLHFNKIIKLLPGSLFFPILSCIVQNHFTCKALCVSNQRSPFLIRFHIWSVVFTAVTVRCAPSVTDKLFSSKSRIIQRSAVPWLTDRKEKLL